MTPTRTHITRETAELPLFAGVDVGGTNTKFGLVDNQGRTLFQSKIPTHAERPADEAMPRIADSLSAMLAEANVDRNKLAAVGLATPGTMDVPAGMLIRPHNLPGWQNYPIRDRLSDACGYSVAFANDANAAAFGEYWVGTGRAFPSMIMLTLGTGVGGGIIVNGLSIDGENSHGSELGHIIIDYGPDALICGCGQSGHLEAYASAVGLLHRTRKALKSNTDSSLHQRLSRGDELSPLLLAQEAEKDDRLSIDLIMETAMYLGVGVVSLMHTIDPGAVVLGGAMTFGGASSELGHRFLERVREEVRQRAFPVLVDRITVDFASLGGDAGYIGAAGIARHNYLDG